MYRKILLLCFIFLLAGCFNDSQVMNQNGKSRSYLFFKDFNFEHYYVSFWDRNTSINDDSLIIMARDNDKYYYEFDGYEKNIIIQKEGLRYNINFDRREYYKEDKDLEDFAFGILPSDLEILKKKYKSGREKIFKKSYYFEKYKIGKNETTYYFNGNKLVYIRYKSIENIVLLKFNEYKENFSSEIFDINSEFNEVTY